MTIAFASSCVFVWLHTDIMSQRASVKLGRRLLIIRISQIMFVWIKSGIVWMCAMHVCVCGGEKKTRKWARSLLLSDYSYSSYMDTSRCEQSKALGLIKYEAHSWITALTHTAVHRTSWHHDYHRLFCRQIPVISLVAVSSPRCFRLISLSSLLLLFHTLCLPFFSFFPLTADLLFVSVFPLHFCLTLPLLLFFFNLLTVCL